MRYVALLRGINVGGGNRVEMPRLKIVFEKLGYQNVTTYINSGNVLFDAESPYAQKIEASINAEFGLNIPTLIVPQEKLQKLAATLPTDWITDAVQKTDIIFLWDDIANESTMRDIASNPEVDNLQFIDGVIIWHINRADYTKSKIADFIKNPLYKKCTVRNINTLRKLTTL